MHKRKVPIQISLKDDRLPENKSRTCEGGKVGSITYRHNELEFFHGLACGVNLD